MADLRSRTYSLICMRISANGKKCFPGAFENTLFEVISVGIDTIHQAVSYPVRLSGTDVLSGGFVSPRIYLVRIG